MLRAERGGVDAQKWANCDKLNAVRTLSSVKLNQNVNFAWQAGMLTPFSFIVLLADPCGARQGGWR